MHERFFIFLFLQRFFSIIIIFAFLFLFSFFFHFFCLIPRGFLVAQYLATAKSNLHKLLATGPAATTGPGAGIFGASGARRLPPPPRQCTLAVPSAERLSAAGVPLS